MSDLGVSQSVNGLVNEAWFNVNAYRNDEGTREAPGIHAIQTDSVWGFRNACPIEPSEFGPVLVHQSEACRQVTADAPAASCPLERGFELV